MKNTIWLSVFLVTVFTSLTALAEDVITLEDIVVTEKRLVKPTKQTDETVYTGSEITKEGLEAQGAKAAISVYEAVNVLPGISVESVDPYALAADQKNIRIRGVRGWFGAMTVSGVPNWGYNPIGPRDYLYDMENFEGIAVYKGAVPADLGTGVGARGGVVELRPRWPEDKRGVDISQSLGEDHYSRTFLRLDSGALPTVGTRLSLAGSYTDAEKWKGPGDLGPRKNANIMLSHTIRQQDDIQVWFNINDMEQNLYRPLSYAEVQDLGSNYEKDYNATLTGVAAQDIHYYDYNRGDYSNRDFLSVIPLTLSDTLQLTFKPYYSTEDTEIFQGTKANNQPVIQKRIRDLERYGLISHMNFQFSSTTAALGYLFESSDMIVRTQNFDVVTGDFRGYGMYTKNDDDGIVHSPYFKLAGSIGKLDWQAGLKYFYYDHPDSQGYTSPPPAYDLVKAPDLYVKGDTYDELLPTLGANYRLTDNMEIYASYGRSQMRPYAYIPPMTLYNNRRADFQEAGVTLNDLFEGFDMEITDSVEIGARFRTDRMEIMPTVFYSNHKDLLTTVHDPRIGANGVNYFQNVGDATGYGFEVETNFFIGSHATFFFNPTYTSLTYDKDLTYAGATLNTKDEQVVDTPEWMLKTGLIFSWGNFELVPMVRYLDERYGDAENTEEIDDYVVADLKISYTREDLSFVDALKVSLEFTNLFDEEYVSLIHAMDDNRAGSPSYYVGAPFTSLLTVSLEF
jgi:iron complex outermembrane receptor protein